MTIKPNIWWWCAQAAVSRRPRPAHNYRRFTIVQLWLLPTSRWATLGLAGLFTSLVLILGHPVHFQNCTITSKKKWHHAHHFLSHVDQFGTSPAQIAAFSLTALFNHLLFPVFDFLMVPLSRRNVMGSVLVPLLTEKELQEDYSSSL